MTFLLGSKRGTCLHKYYPNNSLYINLRIQKRAERTPSLVRASVYLSSRRASLAHPPEAPGWLCGRRCCPSDSSGLPGKGICLQRPGSWQGRSVQREAACHLGPAGTHSEPAGPRLSQFCPLGGQTKTVKHQVWLHGPQENHLFLSLVAPTTNFSLTLPHSPDTNSF